MNLSNEILQVCFDIHEKRKTPLEGQEQILRLLIVVGQSKRLKLNPQICYKNNELCKYDCHGLCKESC